MDCFAAVFAPDYSICIVLSALPTSHTSIRTRLDEIHLNPARKSSKGTRRIATYVSDRGHYFRICTPTTTFTPPIIRTPLVGMIPLPVKGPVGLGPPSGTVIATVPGRDPLESGENVTLTVQAPEGARVEPQLLV